MDNYKFYAIIKVKLNYFLSEIKLFLRKKAHYEFTTYWREISSRNQSVHQGAKRNLFSGPGGLVAVGYMDPGNWITSVVGGAQYRYLLLSIVLLSSLIAMQLQQMAGKLGIVHRKDLAQTTAHHLSK